LDSNTNPTTTPISVVNKKVQNIPVSSSSSSSTRNAYPQSAAMLSVEDVISAPNYHAIASYSAASNSSSYPATFSNGPDSSTTHASLSAIESAVYYIVALPYDILNNKRASGHGNGEELFFPAYDHNHELVSSILLCRDFDLTCMTCSLENRSGFIPRRKTNEMQPSFTSTRWLRSFLLEAIIYLPLYKISLLRTWSIVPKLKHFYYFICKAVTMKMCILCRRQILV
jgi:hypothetical protein